MNLFYSLFKLRLNLLKSEKKYPILFLSLPILAIAIALFIGGIQKDIVKIPIAIVDEDSSDYSKVLIERLEQKQSVEIISYDEASSLSKLKKEEIEALFIIKNGFMESILKNKYKEIIELIQSPSSISIGIVRELVASEVNRLSTNVSSAHYVKKMYDIYDIQFTNETWEQAWNYADKQWEPTPLLTMKYSEEKVDHNLDAEVKTMQQNHLKRYFGFISAIIMLIILLFNQWILHEKQNGILTRMTFSPIRPRKFLVISILNIFVFFIAILIPVILFITFYFQLPITSLMFLFLSISLYVMCCMAISLFLGSSIPQLKQYQISVIFITLITSIIGGSFLKLSDLSSAFLKLAIFTPQHWYLFMINNIIVEQPIHLLVTPAIILTTFTLLFFAMSYFLLGAKHD
jgi:ABC-2 type transport system permease protein